MNWKTPERSPWVAHFNAMGTGQRDGGESLLPLDADKLMADARRATGLNSYGDDWFQEPLRVLVKSFNEEAELNTVGRFVARSELSRLLQYRLLVEDEIARHPEILEQPVAPVHVVTGLGRTGTSILHELLTLDPDNRVPMQWEMMYPHPPPQAKTFATDARMRQADLEIRFMEEVIPAVRTMHEHAGDLPNECIFLFAFTFASDVFSGRFNLPSYDMWMATNEMTPAYEYHKRMLRFLQWKHPKPRWVLKAPSHLSRLQYLFKAYPDAKVAITHRDPLKVLASTANLLSTLKYLHSDAVNYDADLQRIAFGNHFLCEQLTNDRQAKILPEAQISDVRYAELMGDPVASVKSLYQQWDIPFARELANRVAEYLRDKPKGKFGDHSYSFEDTGLNLAEERARYQAYQAYFDVPSEV